MHAWLNDPRKLVSRQHQKDCKQQTTVLGER